MRFLPDVQPIQKSDTARNSHSPIYKTSNVVDGCF